jgi:hypothetical protein
MRDNIKIEMRNKNVTTEKRRAQMLAYQEANREKINKYNSDYKIKKCKEDPLFLEESRLRRLINMFRRYGGYGKKSKLNQIIGLPYNDFITWIESQWQPGMSWENYGNKRGQWAFEHENPTSTARSSEELISRFHFLNTRPMWQSDNVRKSNF